MRSPFFFFPPKYTFSQGQKSCWIRDKFIRLFIIIFGNVLGNQNGNVQLQPEMPQIRIHPDFPRIFRLIFSSEFDNFPTCGEMTAFLFSLPFLINISILRQCISKQTLGLPKIYYPFLLPEMDIDTEFSHYLESRSYSSATDTGLGYGCYLISYSL